jgi:YebC/PmpR family DNA-binding regulatory protein
MSGHSKWHNIAQKKGKADKARSNIFTKLCKAITIATSQGGKDPTTNFSLRMAIEKARDANVPKDNIERAIKRGTGEDKDAAMVEQIMYEIVGPGGISFVVETLTDNKNRTASEIKHVCNKYGGALGGPGSVVWQYRHCGVIRISQETKQSLNWPEIEVFLIDHGADDMTESAYGVEIITKKEQLQSLMLACIDKQITLDESGLEWIPNETIQTDEIQHAAVEILYDQLDALDDVKTVYTNEA